MIVLRSIDPARRTVEFGPADATPLASAAASAYVTRMRELGIDWIKVEEPQAGTRCEHRFSAGDDWIAYAMEAPVGALTRAHAAFYSAATLATARWVSDEDVKSLHLAIYELLVNVIDHGRPLDESSKLLLEIRLTRGLSTIRITDGCEQFSPEGREVESALERARHHAARGYGVTLIERAVDRVTWDFGPRGNIVQLEKGTAA